MAYQVSDALVIYTIVFAPICAWRWKASQFFLAATWNYISHKSSEKWCAKKSSMIFDGRKSRVCLEQQQPVGAPINYCHRYQNALFQQIRYDDERLILFYPSSLNWTCHCRLNYLHGLRRQRSSRITAHEAVFVCTQCYETCLRSYCFAILSIDAMPGSASLDRNTQPDPCSQLSSW